MRARTGEGREGSSGFRDAVHRLQPVPARETKPRSRFRPKWRTTQAKEQLNEQGGTRFLDLSVSYDMTWRAISDRPNPVAASWRWRRQCVGQRTGDSVKSGLPDVAHHVRESDTSMCLRSHQAFAMAPGCCPPRHPTRFEPSCIELNGILWHPVASCGTLCEQFLLLIRMTNPLWRSQIGGASLADLVSPSTLTGFKKRRFTTDTSAETADPVWPTQFGGFAPSPS
jgi:hypothetical protein